MTGANFAFWQKCNGLSVKIACNVNATQISKQTKPGSFQA